MDKTRYVVTDYEKHTGSEKDWNKTVEEGVKLEGKSELFSTYGTSQGKHKKKAGGRYKKMGKAFETEVMNSLQYWSREYNYWYKKLVDTNSYDFNVYCAKCKRKIRTRVVMPKAIGDMIVVGPHSTLFIECKSTKQQFFPLANIKDHQWRYGNSINQFQHSDYVFLINDRRIQRSFKCYYIFVTDLNVLVNSLNISIHSGKLPWNVLIDNSVEIRRISGGMWDLRPLLVHVTDVDEVFNMNGEM